MDQVATRTKVLCIAAGFAEMILCAAIVLIAVVIVWALCVACFSVVAGTVMYDEPIVQNPIDIEKTFYDSYGTKHTHTAQPEYRLAFWKCAF